MISCCAACSQGTRFATPRVKTTCAFGKRCRIREAKVAAFEDAVAEEHIVVAVEKGFDQLEVVVGCIVDVEEVAVVVEEDTYYICH